MLKDLALFGLALLGAAGPAQSASAADRTTLTGDWGGLRAQLAEDGVKLRADYVSESFAAVAGGERRGAAYTQQVRAGLDLDMARIAGWTGGTFHFTVNDRRGVGLSAQFVGNRLPIQEAYGGQYTRLSELSYEQELGVVNLRAGFFAMGNDLGGVAAGCAFVNAAFCAHPLSMSGNSNWYNYPNARWGAALRIRARDDLLVRTGVYQVNPALGERDNAFNPFAGRTTGVILPVEIEYLPGQRAGDRLLPGSYKIGFYYDTAEADRTPPPGKVNARMGFYVLAQQTLTRTTAGKPALAAIGAFTVNPAEAAQITRWYMAGLVNTGTFAGRPEDVLGIGVVHAKLNPRVRAASAPIGNPGTGVGQPDSLPAGETAIELSYGVQVNRWLLVRPDVQYILDPGAFSHRSTPDALAVGVQVKMQI